MKLALPSRLLRDYPFRCFLVLALSIVLICVGWYFLVRHGFIRLGQAHLPKEHHRLEILANVGAAFQIIAAMFTALAFAGVLFTVYLQGAQMQAGLNQDHLDSLQKRVGELIGNAGNILNVLPDGTIPALRVAIREVRRTKEWEKTDTRVDPFLADLSKCLEDRIPTNDEQRRRYVFKALHSLISNAPPNQRKLFKESLLAQIHEGAARVLILQAIAVKDRELLEIFGHLGLGFSSFEKDIPDLSKELEERFPTRKF
jgi:hypothetical protein